MVLLNGALLIGPVLLLSSITVFVRDLAQAMPSLLQALFWATPIVYTAEMVTGRYPAMSGFFLVNPAYHLVSAYREILLLGQVPSAGSLIYLCVLAAISYGVGRWVFQRLRPVFADES
jgi:lipopolysaccharide transport system permease protein